MMCHRLTMLRKQARMSQLELSRALHVSASTIGMYEQGRRTPDLDVLIRMSHLFDVSLDYLITGTEFTPSSDNFDSSRSVENCPCHTCYWKEYKLRYWK